MRARLLVLSEAEARETEVAVRGFIRAHAGMPVPPVLSSLLAKLVDLSGHNVDIASGSGDDEVLLGALPISEVAVILNVCTKTVWRRIADGELSAITVGRRKLVAVPELVRYMNKSDAA